MSSPTFFYALTSVFKMSFHTLIIPLFLFSRCLSKPSLCFRFCLHDVLPYFPYVFTSVFMMSSVMLSLCFRFCLHDVFPYSHYTSVSVSKISFHTFLVPLFLFSRCLSILSLYLCFCFHDVFFHNHPIPLSFLFSHSLLWQIVCSGIMILFLPFDFFIC